MRDIISSLQSNRALAGKELPQPRGVAKNSRRRANSRSRQSGLGGLKNDLPLFQVDQSKVPTGRSVEKLDLQNELAEKSATRNLKQKRQVGVKDSLHLSVAMSEGTFD